MKLYNKVGKSMNVDKGQMEICLKAGWSRTDETAGPRAIKAAKEAAAQALIDARELLAADVAEKAQALEDAQALIDKDADKDALPVAPKKIVRTKPLKKQ